MRILLADDHALVLAGVQQALEADGGFDVVGATTNGADVLPLVGQRAPDVVLLDLQLPKLDGLACLGRIRDRHPGVKVVMLSMFGDPDQVEIAFARGACGYITKSIDSADLGPAIRQAVDGTAFHALGLRTETDPDETASGGLTERELRTVRAVARGLSNSDVAKELWVTEQTVKFHLTNVYRKIGVRNRTEAARWAFARGLVDETDPGADDHAVGRATALADAHAPPTARTYPPLGVV
jgi:DNA-binding NarL/FixJ family response regulator